MNGVQTYDEEDEACHLMPLNLPKEGAGMASLKSRLPPLFAELIRKNIPKLECGILEVIQLTRDKLRDVGEEPLSHDAMLRQCQMVLKDCSVQQLQEPISALMHVFQQEVMATKDKVTKDWSDAKLKPNVFECPFFQGNEALQACMQDVTSWWQPILEAYCTGVERIARAHVKDVLTGEAHGAPLSLRSAIVSEWESECNTLFVNLKDIFGNRLHKEVPFGTVNHYLTAKFAEAHTLPDQVVDDCIVLLRSKWEEAKHRLMQEKQQAERKLTEAKHHADRAAAEYQALSEDENSSVRSKAARDQKESAASLKRAETYLKAKPTEIDIEMTADAVRTSLVQAKTRWVAAFDNSSLHEQ